MLRINNLMLFFIQIHIVAVNLVGCDISMGYFYYAATQVILHLKIQHHLLRPRQRKYLTCPLCIQPNFY